MRYHFDKNFIPSHTLQEQIAALKEKLKRDAEQWAVTQPPEPFDDDDLDEVDHGPSKTGW